MPKNRTRRGFTWIELVDILVVLAVLLGLLMPAILNIRENSRRETCTNNLKQIGLGLQNYFNAYKYFPGSAEMVGSLSDKKAGGWSFLFKTLPYNGYPEIYSGIVSTLHEGTVSDPITVDPLTHPDSNLTVTRNAVFPIFLCPSNPNKTYEDPDKKQVAFTNYKAMGATCMESLLLCENPESPPPYGDKSSHPDGALFPTNSGIRIIDLTDGLSPTIMVVETIDDSKSCWLAGTDTTLVGMPKAKSYQQFDGDGFWSPLDYAEHPGLYECSTPALRALRTFTAFDFRPGYPDAGTYPAGVGRTPDYGPSSNHPGVVNHLYCDGSVRSIRKDVDYTGYFFMSTRKNRDPDILHHETL